MDELRAQEMNGAARAAQAIRAKFSQLNNIIIALIILVLITAGTSAVLLYLRLTNDPSKNLISNIPTQILKKPETTNKVENRLIDDKLITTYTTTQLDRIGASLYPSYSILSAKYDEDEYVIHFTSTDQNGQPLNIRAQLFVPKGAKDEKFPLFVFGQGTTGLGDQCAPSMEKPQIDNWGNYSNHLRTYAGQGFITVFPDYEGFNDDKRIHHYFNAQLESNVLLDATRAALEFLPDQSEQAAFYGGYSQGGNAIFAVKDNQPTYAPEIPLKGIVGFGPTTDVTNLLKENADLSPYLLYSYADFYGKDKVDVNQLFQSKWLPTLEKDVLTKCISAVFNYYGSDASQIYTPRFFDSLYHDKLAQDFPTMKKLFDQNSSGLKKSSVPAFIVQSDPDSIVSVKVQEEFINKACQVGSVITYTKYKNVSHFQTRHVSFKDAVGWMHSILAGNKVQSVCDNLGDLNTAKTVPQETSKL